jgi:beta-glucanase (GH16 family)
VEWWNISVPNVKSNIDNSSVNYVTTRNGKLVISTKAEKTTWYEWDEGAKEMASRTRNYTSGMVQSWNKFCFTGGVLELSIKLPGGNANAGGIVCVIENSRVLFMFMLIGFC